MTRRLRKLVKRPQLSRPRGVIKSARLRIHVSLAGTMFTLLEVIAFVVLVAVSLAGFAAAIAWTFAIWFGNRG
jgi:hypothetical protein